jgi:hypothetical protein
MGSGQQEEEVPLRHREKLEEEEKNYAVCSQRSVYFQRSNRYDRFNRFPSLGLREVKKKA